MRRQMTMRGKRASIMRPKMIRKKWENRNGYYEDVDDKENLYGTFRTCYDCMRVFYPVDLSIPRMCGQMLIDGVKYAQVYKYSTCKRLLSCKGFDGDD
jgi:hypothetical protein